jgi:plasmid stabilization system protein ParE
VTFSFHPEAERDIAEAMDFYAGQTGLAVAGRFLDEVERAIRLLVEYPDLGMPIAKGQRPPHVSVECFSLRARVSQCGKRDSHPDRSAPAQKTGFWAWTSLA